MALSAATSMRLKASWDTSPIRTETFKLSSLKNTVKIKTLQPTIKKKENMETEITQKKELDVSELLKIKRNSSVSENHFYMGYETWMPAAPKVKKPQSIYNAVSLAYIGDCIYELYARRHFLYPPLNIEEYSDRVMATVRCEAQDALLQKLMDDDYLSNEERDILRWGKNISSGRTKTKKRVGTAVYNRASSLETLLGYLYITNVSRLDDIMKKLGFSNGSSNEIIVEKLQ